MSSQNQNFYIIITQIGHSFGEKIIVDLVSKLDYHPNKIILIDSAGIKPKKSLIQKFNLYRYKFLKKVILKLYSKEKASLLVSSLQKEISNSGLVIIKNSNHFPFLDHPYESLVIIDNFLSN